MSTLLMKLCPCHNSIPDEWDVNSASIVQKYHDFLCSERGKAVKLHTVELQRVQRALHLQNEITIDSSDDEEVCLVFFPLE